jgi:hypothetical protein
MLKLVNLMLENVAPEEGPCAMPTEILPEAEMNHRTMNLDKAYDVFNQSYIKSTGKSWEKDKFIERAYGWTFFGDENGYVAVRPQQSGMVKFVGVAGSLKSIYKGIQELKAKYNSVPVWGMVSKEISDQVGKLGFKTLRLKNDLSSKIFLKLLKTVIPASVFGGAEITGINSDGTLSFQYKDVGEVNKVLIGNDKYFDALRDKILAHDKIPEFMKVRLTKLFNDPNAITEDYDISEERKNPDINIKEPFSKRLRDLAREDDIFVSFTTVKKAGIFPRSNYDTPLGVYCYPLKLSAARYKNVHGVIGFPFAADRKNAMILRKKPGIKELIISKYTKADGDNDINTLLEIWNKDEKVKPFLSNIFEEAKSTTRFRSEGIGVFWNFCRILSENVKNIHGIKSTVTWNKLLRKDLGYDLIVDDAGKGVIHSNEPLQAFFTNSNAFTVVEGIDNPAANSNRANLNYSEIAKYPSALLAFLKRRDYSAYDLRALFSVHTNREELVRLIVKIKGDSISTIDVYTILTHSEIPVKNVIGIIGKHNLDKIDVDSANEIFDETGDKAGILYAFGKPLVNKLSAYRMGKLFGDNLKNNDVIINYILDTIDPEEIADDIVEVLANYTSNKIEFAKKLFNKVEPTQILAWPIVRTSKDRISTINELGLKQLIESNSFYVTTLINSDNQPSKLIEFFGIDSLKNFVGMDLQKLFRHVSELGADELQSVIGQFVKSVGSDGLTPDVVASIAYHTEDLYNTVKMFPPGTFNKISGDRIGDIMVKHGPIQTLDILGKQSIVHIVPQQLRRILTHLSENHIQPMVLLQHVGHDIIGKLLPDSIRSIIRFSTAIDNNQDNIEVGKFIIDARGDKLTEVEVYNLLYETKNGDNLVKYIGSEKMKTLTADHISQLLGKLWNDTRWFRIIIEQFGVELPPDIVKTMFSYISNRKELALLMASIMGESAAINKLNASGIDAKKFFPGGAVVVPETPPLNESLDYIKYCKKFMM